ncbi:hypothetical protein ACFHW0_31330 [Micromonospora sp. LOL_025]|uniref:CdiA C-terminal domain-containing protein n=1 Tax=Micromonospora sp. LOL_025 TaxID=3345413 RepID=UPI003A871F75
MRRSLELENQCADIVADRGYQVHQNPTKQEIAEARSRTGDTGEVAKDPDYLIEGLVFDCYSPRPSRAVRGIWTGVSDKVASQQTQRVVLNLHDWRGNLAALQRQFDDWPIPRLEELVAVTRSGALIEIVRRN